MLRQRNVSITAAKARASPAQTRETVAQTLPSGCAANPGRRRYRRSAWPRARAEQLPPSVEQQEGSFFATVIIFAARAICSTGVGQLGQVAKTQTADQPCLHALLRRGGRPLSNHAAGNIPLTCKLLDRSVSSFAEVADLYSEGGSNRAQLRSVKSSAHSAGPR